MSLDLSLDVRKKQEGLDHPLTHTCWLTGHCQVHIFQGWAQNWGVQGIIVPVLGSPARSSSSAKPSQTSGQQGLGHQTWLSLDSWHVRGGVSQVMAQAQVFRHLAELRIFLWGVVTTSQLCWLSPAGPLVTDADFLRWHGLNTSTSPGVKQVYLFTSLWLWRLP